MSLEFTKDNFQTEVIESDRLVLVDFWATWCGPCRAIGPLVEELSQTNPHIKVGKVNADEQQELCAANKIDALPTILFFKNGKVVNRFVGLQTRTTLQNAINNLANESNPTEQTRCCGGGCGGNASFESAMEKANRALNGKKEDCGGACDGSCHE